LIPKFVDTVDKASLFYENLRKQFLLIDVVLQKLDLEMPKGICIKITLIIEKMLYFILYITAI